MGLPFQGLLPCLLEEDNKALLQNVLLYHVVNGTVLSTDLPAVEANADGATTLLGESVTVDLSDGVKINDANVIAADIGTAAVLGLHGVPYHLRLGDCLGAALRQPSDQVNLGMAWLPVYFFSCLYICSAASFLQMPL